MGEIDIEILMNINEEIKKLKTKYSFKVDHGTYETAIEFWAMGYHHPPKAKNWDSNPEIRCPDLLDYSNKLIIEYEEEPKPGKQGGKLGKKGHTSESDNDTNRDMLYRIGGFKLCKIWETEYKDNTYVEKLRKFLIEN